MRWLTVVDKCLYDLNKWMAWHYNEVVKNTVALTKWATYTIIMVSFATGRTALGVVVSGFLWSVFYIYLAILQWIKS